MKRIMNGIFLGCATLSLLAFGPCDRSNDQKGKKLIIVNVLEKKYHDNCHIKGSINVNIDDLEKAAASWNKDSSVVVYCANYMCTASGDGARALKKMGFEKVWAYEAGTAEWAQLYPELTEGPCTDGYLKQYEKPENYQEAHDIEVISSQDLKKMMEELN